MKGIAAFLSLALAAPVLGQAPGQVYDQAASTTPAYTHPPVVISAPRLADEEDATAQRLKTTRTVGGVTALSGFAILGYAIVSGATGPLGWAVGLICLGGLTAYHAHKNLKTKRQIDKQNAGP